MHRALLPFLLVVACNRPAVDAGGENNQPATVVTVPPAAVQPSVNPSWVASLPEVDASIASGDAGANEPDEDPLDGKFTLADALKGLPGTGQPTATIDTVLGTLTCKLYADKAPITVANFIGLARGVRPWRDPSGHWVTRPAYDGTTFHRVVKGFMIQGGDPKGNGLGEPGYAIPDEIWPGSKHDRAGLLCMANAGPNTNGQQFFITDGPAPHIDKHYTIFGECTPLDVIHSIAATPVRDDRALVPPKIRKITIKR